MFYFCLSSLNYFWMHPAIRFAYAFDGGQFLFKLTQHDFQIDGVLLVCQIGSKMNG